MMCFTICWYKINASVYRSSKSRQEKSSLVDARLLFFIRSLTEQCCADFGPSLNYFQRDAGTEQARYRIPFNFGAGKATG
jgi:hypothetical protein